MAVNESALPAAGQPFEPGFPRSDEYAPAFGRYISRAVRWSDPVQGLRDQLSTVERLLEPLAPEQQIHRYAPEKWSVKQILGHLSDAERIFSYRALRFARTDQTALPSFDENVYVDAAQAERVPWAGLLIEFHHVRHSSIALFRHLPPEAWMRSGFASGHLISVRALAYTMLGHVEHHLTILSERYGVGAAGDAAGDAAGNGDRADNAE